MKRPLAAGLALALLSAGAAGSIYFATRTHGSSSQELRLSTEKTMGKVNKDLFPDLTSPGYVPAKDAAFLQDDDDVILLRGRERTLAFPVVMMGWHHIVNDEIDGEPFALTFCILADTAVTFSRRLEGRTHSFGVLGNLYFGDMIMYDRETDSQFLQITGDAFAGTHQGRRLSVLQPPLRIPWRRAKGIAGLQVLAPQRDMEYYRIFFDKNKDAAHGLRTVEAKGPKPDPRAVPLTPGLALAHRNESAFFSLTAIERTGVVNDVVGELPVVLLFDATLETHRMFGRRVGERVLSFRLAEGGFRDRETDSLWNSEGEALDGPLLGEKLSSPDAVRVFWYTWSAFFPSTRILASDLP